MTDVPSSAPAGHDFVRPFIMTGGRTSARRTELRLETLVQRTGSTVALDALATEKAAVLTRCGQPISVAEIGAALGLVVGVVRVLVDDLIQSGHLEVFDVHEDSDDDLDDLLRITEKMRTL